MTCDEARDLLLEARSERPPDLEEHLARCAGCNAMVQEMHMIDASLAPLRAVTASPEAKKKWASSKARASFLRAALPLAAAAAFLAVAVFAILRTPTVIQDGTAPAIQEREEEGVAVNGLKLTLQPARKRFAFKETLEFTVTFENVGAKEIAFWTPELPPPDTFPDLLISAGGTEYRLHRQPFQTVGGVPGLQVKLAAGEKKAFTVRNDRVTLDGERPIPLPEGEYRVIARYPGGPWVPQDLWPGTVSSGARTIRVAPPEGVTCALIPGEGSVVNVVLTNHLKRAVELKEGARVEFSISRKASGSGTAIVPIRRDEPDVSVQAEGLEPIRLRPGERGEYRVNLARLEWTSSNKRIKERFGLYEIVPPDNVASLGLEIACEDDADVKKIAADPVSIRIKPPAADLKLKLTLSAERKSVRRGEPVRVKLALANPTNVSYPVNRRFAYPADVCFAVQDAEGKKPAACSVAGRPPTDFNDLTRPDFDDVSPVITEGMSWSSDAFAPRKGLVQEDFADLAPGESVEAAFDLNALVKGGLAPGKHRVTFIYRNWGSPMVKNVTQMGRAESNAVDVEVTE